MLDMNNGHPKIALVHDWLVSQGGGEHFLLHLHQMFPEAPIYTLVYDEEKAPAWTRGLDVRTTHIQKWPGGKTHHKYLLSFMPKAWEALDLTEYDLVISSCASCCKGVITRPDAVHICYCHSPIRYVWDLYYDYLEGTSALKRAFMPAMIHKVRMWDFQAAQRVDYFVANSKYVAKRISKFYRRDAEVVYSGIDIPSGAVTEERGDYYFVLSRFVGYKRVDIAIEACNKLGRKLIVAGSGGEEEERLRAMAGPTVEFVGRVSDEQLTDYYAHAKAFLFPGIEDFGLTPLEAMAGGTPVLAYGEGGALETVVDGETGMFFHEQSAEALAKCIEDFEGRSFSAAACRARAEQFSTEAFKENMRKFCLDALAGEIGGA